MKAAANGEKKKKRRQKLGPLERGELRLSEMEVECQSVGLHVTRMGPSGAVAFIRGGCW